MSTIQLVGIAQSGHKVLVLKDLHVPTLEDAQVWAPHEIDLELHLSKYTALPDLTARMVQVLKDGQVIWKLTEAERAYQVRSGAS